METARCKQCGRVVDAFVCGEGRLIQDITPKMDDKGMPLVTVVRFFRTREGFNNWVCEVCNPPIDYDDAE